MITDKPNNLKGKDKNGFTLVEILMAIAIFFLVISSVFGLFVSVLKSQRRGLASQEVIDNMNHNLEYMSRALRMARKQTADMPPCLSQDGLNYERTRQGQGIKFLNYQGICHEFYLDSSRIYQQKDAEILPLTPQNLTVSYFNFSARGTSGTDKRQPRVSFFVTIRSNNPKPEDRAEINIQTGVAQRELDVP